LIDVFIGTQYMFFTKMCPASTRFVNLAQWFTRFLRL